MTRARRRRPGERGSVTAEFVASLPAVVLVLALCLGALHVAAVQVRAQDAAADAARLVARGDALELAEDRVEAALPGAALAVHEAGDLLCAEVRSEVVVAGFVTIVVEAESCALGGGR